MYGRSQLMTTSANGEDEPFPTLQANVKGAQKTAVTWNRMSALAMARRVGDQAEASPVGVPGVERFSGDSGCSSFAMFSASVLALPGGKDFRLGNINRQETKNPSVRDNRNEGS